MLGRTPSNTCIRVQYVVEPIHIPKANAVHCYLTKFIAAGVLLSYRIVLGKHPSALAAQAPKNGGEQLHGGGA